MWRKGNPHALLLGMQTGAATVESSMELPQKIKKGPWLEWLSGLNTHLQTQRLKVQFPVRAHA